MQPDESLYPPEWMRYAERDLGRVPRALRDGDPELAGFCLQQAVEKFLKAFLLTRGWKLRRIHDLEALLDAAIAFAPEMDSFRPTCQEITDYYIVERYPSRSGSKLTPDRIEDTMRAIQGLIDIIRGLVP